MKKVFFSFIFVLLCLSIITGCGKKKKEEEKKEEKQLICIQEGEEYQEYTYIYVDDKMDSFVEKSDILYAGEEEKYDENVEELENAFNLSFHDLGKMNVEIKKYAEKDKVTAIISGKTSEIDTYFVDMTLYNKSIDDLKKYYEEISYTCTIK